MTGVAGIVDLLGYGTSNTFEGAVAAVAGTNGTPNSLARTGFADTDNNGADFVSTGTVTPQNSGGATDPTDPTDPGDPTTYTIDEIQGSGEAPRMSRQTVTTTGIVTAAYGTGGFNGYYIQTPGTGGALDLATHTASDAIFVYSPSTAASVAIGDYVQVTGTVSEFFGLTRAHRHLRRRPGEAHRHGRPRRAGHRAAPG